MVQKTSETGASNEGMVSRPRTRPSYFKTTQSSRNKVNRNSDGGQDLSPASSDSSNSLPRKKTVRGQGRLSGTLASSRMSFYASTPNLLSTANISDEEEDEKEVNKRYSTSNLQSLADLSRSVPDVNDADSSTDTSSTGSGRPQRKSVFGAAAKITSRYAGGLTDKELMPPPTTPSKASSWKDNAKTQSGRRNSAKEMTLDEAKSILMGKSSILSNKPVDSTVTVATVGSSRSGNSYQNAQSSKQEPGFSVQAPSATDDSVFEPTPSQLAVAEEIELTANLLRHQATANIVSPLTPSSHVLSNLEASPLDLPERDLSVSPKVQKQSLGSSTLNSASSQSSHSHHPVTVASSSGFKTSPLSANQTKVVDGEQDDDERKRSVRDRIAQYNLHNRGKSPVNSSLPFKAAAGRSSSPYRRVLPTSPGGPNVTADTMESSRSYSDTGLGSGSDTDGSGHSGSQKNGDAG